MAINSIQAAVLFRMTKRSIAMCKRPNDYDVAIWKDGKFKAEADDCYTWNIRNAVAVPWRQTWNDERLPYSWWYKRLTQWLSSDNIGTAL